MATKKQQIDEVVEGMGLGLLALGVTRVSSWKLDIEFAFSHAWHRWPHASDYPSFGRAMKPDNEFWIGVTNSERRKSASVVWRKAGRDYEIAIAFGGNDWTPEEVVGHVGDRPLDQWVALASAYCEHERQR
jgi:hypothetical protein